ncbi:hypothetical protein P8452_44479 [Trifolium repens]|nr:hypothetical protein P8452_44479 [Trifolium repens]
MNKEVKWSNSYLPKELWDIIFKKLNTAIDVIRFHSICSLWRSLLPPPPTPQNLCIPHRQYFLLQTKIYRIEPSRHDRNLSTTSSSSTINKGWIIKVFQNSKSSKLNFLDLFTNKRFRTKETTEKVLNLMNFRVVELFELYTESRHIDKIDDEFTSVHNVCKVILFPSEDRCLVFTLHNDKRLNVSIIGEKTKIIVLYNDTSGVSSFFYDMINYKEQLYVVDKKGTIFWINSLSLKLVQFSPMNMYCCHVENMRVSSTINKKQLVEYDGFLYVVDMYHRRHYLNAVFVEVYKFDQEWGKWFEVKDLGDVSFVLGKDSNFALLAQDYYGCKGNCIYFYFESRTFCFNLKNLESRPTNIFWPLPTLFHSMTS